MFFLIDHYYYRPDAHRAGTKHRFWKREKDKEKIQKNKKIGNFQKSSKS